MADETVNQSCKSSDEELDNVWSKFLACAPLVTNVQEVMELEQVVDDEGILRRLVLATMQFGGAELLSQSQEDEGAQMLALALVAGEKWEESTKSLLELVAMQLLRLRLSLFERPDMDVLLAKAAGELFDTTGDIV